MLYRSKQAILIFIFVAVGLFLSGNLLNAADKWLFAIAAANGADLITTEIALKDESIHELNPLARTRTNRIAIKLGATVISWYGAKLLEQSGHKKIADAIRCVSIAVPLGAAGWNISVMIRK